jgi:AraC-like DNA-binding protein
MPSWQVLASTGHPVSQFGLVFAAECLGKWGRTMSEANVDRRPPPKVEVHLAASAEFDAFEPWHASLSSLFFDVSLIGDDAQSRFRGDVTGFHLGDSLVFNSRSVGHRHMRDPSFIRRTAIDHIMIEFQTEGHRSGDFGDRDVDVHPGDVSFIDFSRTLRSEEPDFSRISLIVPRDRLPAKLRERDLHGVVLDGARGATRLLGRYLVGLVETAGDLSTDETGAAVEAAFVLAEGAWGAARVMSPEQEKAASPALRHMATAYIERNLVSRELAPEAVAAALNISRSTLYRLFDADGGIRAFIIARRLDRAFDALIQARNGSGSVGAVAFAHGFGSEAHFSRAFRQRFGINPNEVRGMAVSGQRLWWSDESGLSALAVMPAWVRNLGAAQTA